MPELEYPIGVLGQPWGADEKKAWLGRQSVKRSYCDEVLKKLELAKEHFDVQTYGSLSYDADRYPLFVAKSRDWDPSKPSILVTGGVHGYETSGVQGALLFLQTEAKTYSAMFNIVVAPCVSPWGYETIQRWNPEAVDPNRSFHAAGTAEEALALMKFINSLNVEKWMCHVDLHETTDSDKLEFRPARAARDGQLTYDDLIPDGYYLVGDSENPQLAWHTAMIEKVRQITHIAPPDDKGQILGAPVVQDGIINFPVKSLGLCASMTNAKYAATTEVYPDSPNASDDLCNSAQVATVVAALDYIIQTELSKENGTGAAEKASAADDKKVVKKRPASSGKGQPMVSKRPSTAYKRPSKA